MEFNGWVLSGVICILATVIGFLWSFNLLPELRPNKEVTPEELEEIRDMRKWDEGLFRAVNEAIRQGPITRRQYKAFRGQFNALVFRDLERFQNTGYETKLFRYMTEEGKKSFKMEN